jgi:spore germination protein YaaH
LIDARTGLDSVRANRAAIRVVSPADYSVTIEGQATRLTPWDAADPIPPGVVRSAMAPGAKLLPLIACLDRCAAEMSKLLAAPRARSAHVAVIQREVKRVQADGVFIDYEGLTCSAEHFSAFIAELRQRFQVDKLEIGVAVTEPCGPPPKCERPEYPFSLRRLAELADYLALMEYDYTVDGSDAVAPLTWVRAGLMEASKVVGPLRHKVYVGLPFYGRLTQGLAPDTGVLWSEVKAGRVQGQALRILEQRYVPEKLSHVARVKYGDKVVRPGTLHFDDHFSLRQRLKLIEDLGFRQIAIWRLGGEDPKNWGEIDAWQRRAPAQ